MKWVWSQGIINDVIKVGVVSPSFVGSYFVCRCHQQMELVPSLRMTSLNISSTWGMRYGSMEEWQYVRMTRIKVWVYKNVNLWQYGSTGEWQYGSIGERQYGSYGSIVEWQYESMGEWQYGSMGEWEYTSICSGVSPLTISSTGTWFKHLTWLTPRPREDNLPTLYQENSLCYITFYNEWRYTSCRIYKTR